MTYLQSLFMKMMKIRYMLRMNLQNWKPYIGHKTL